MAATNESEENLRPFWADAELPRERWLYYAFQARRYGAIVDALAPLGPWPSRRVLDLGGGVGSLAVLLKARLGGRYDLADFSAPSAAHAAALRRAGVESSYSVDLRSRPALSSVPGGYDAILLVEVLEHLLVNPLTLFREVWEHLAPGGLLFVTTPNQARLRNRLRLLAGRSIKEPGRYPWVDKGVYGHVIEFTLDELDRLAAAESFTRVWGSVVQQVPSVAPTRWQRAGRRLLNARAVRGLRLGDDLLAAYRKVDRPADGSCPVPLDPAGRL